MALGYIFSPMRLDEPPLLSMIKRTIPTYFEISQLVDSRVCLVDSSVYFFIFFHVSSHYM